MTRFLAGIDDSVEDERDLDQIMADQRAAEIERDTHDGVQQLASSPHLLHDQGKLSSKLYFRQNLGPFGNVFGECFLRIFSENENKKTNLHFQEMKMRLID